MNLLVIRFSAMGDVALLAPALIALTSEYPSVQITLATRENFTSFFYNIPNVTVIGINFKNNKGIFGIWNYYKELNKLGPFEKVIDLHSSLRSRILSLLYFFKGIPTFQISKGRLEKNMQTRRQNKVLVKLPHTVDRYLSVFEKAGFKVSPRKGPWINTDLDSKVYASNFFKEHGQKREKDFYWIGFAPFAGHKLKVWPFQKSLDLLKAISKEVPSKLFLFGSNEEMESLKILKQDLDNCIIVSGNELGIRGELGIMEKMDLMIGMDSSNIHLAALLGKPVLAIFGTSHPFSGFGPYHQEETGVIQVEGLECRPCSIYGNTTCYRKDFACMEGILIDMVITRIKTTLDSINQLKQMDLYKL